MRPDGTTPVAGPLSLALKGLCKFYCFLEERPLFCNSGAVRCFRFGALKQLVNMGFTFIANTKFLVIWLLSHFCPRVIGCSLLTSHSSGPGERMWPDGTALVAGPLSLALCLRIKYENIRVESILGTYRSCQSIS